MTDLDLTLRLVSAFAVVMGTVLVVLQLRLNARQAKSRNAFDLIGKVIDPSFPARRHRLYEAAERHADGDWAGFYRSLDDFEVRNFASIYEQLGLLVQKGVVDLEDVMCALSAQAVADWATFEPIRAHIITESGKVFPVLAADKPGVESIYWPNFKWLAEQNRQWILRQVSPSDSGAARRAWSGGRMRRGSQNEIEAG